MMCENNITAMRLAMSHKINNINKRFSKDKDGVTTDQTPLTETQVVDLTSYIDELEKEVKSDKSESEIIQSIENISNVKENLPGQLKGTWEDIKAQGLKFIQEVAGDDAADFITGESIGAGAIIGAGSTITADVPSDAIATTRSALDVRHDAASRYRSSRSNEKG